MAQITRHIGLSLGADVDWPLCYEQILERLDLAIPWQGDTLRFSCDRLTIEPFDLRQPVRYDVVIDRLTHWFHLSREWIKKAVILDGVYVFNNPWSVQSMEKQTTYCAMMRLGLPVPDTWLIPAKSYEDKPDLQVTLERYARFFDLGEIGRRLGYPSFMKPYDGGGWVGVSRIGDEEQLREAYETSGRFVMHLQKGVEPHDLFVRGIGLGPQVRFVRYDPSAPLHDRYCLDRGFLGDEDIAVLEDTVLTINAFFGWDFNSCEALRQDRTWYPIDFANPCPDSQSTSLHYHFPWLLAAKLRWSLFCAATRRPMRLNLDWTPWLELAAAEMPWRERLRAYGDLARRRFQKDEFEAFCREHLGHLDQVVHDYFGSEDARRAVRLKVESLYPEHEWDSFTELFWERIQDWRRLESPARPEAAETPSRP